ncbi:PLP-dependent aminotransferase family protein [Rhizorhabdus dicambivorans]|uniref:PLP-dependent aminotransferase family protein n=1 Tax=Rhizorhabdus dicambivorans TaxID=1850238 RepID=A0A2A4G0A2_9SPHN|nr:PLP-dependent aminotransferase family protein [Rhizorhabdus dicambivorans]ATE63226.1 PLP-dependent aminotransferase family protein [Rhizorhabdus dicambivorans]PCE43439.1 PLP-dependent aminotransferase family protein [Rhizorhabdus dicambivorans]
MQSWLDHLGDHSGPKYLAIADAIEQAVRTGTLRPGERLPPQRELAAQLGVDLTTVTRAYGMAREAGLIEGAGRLGSYVRNAAGLPPADLSGDSGMIMPPQPGFALLGDAMHRGMAALLRAGGQSPLLQYQPTGGALRDRQEAAAAYIARGMATGADQVVIAAGGQNALHAILASALERGDRIAAPRITYPGLIAAARQLGLGIDPVAADTGGIDPDAVQAAAVAGAKAIYVVPTNDNPTTATLDLERRLWLAAIVRRHGLTLIEDDAYGLLPAKPLPPLAAFAPERSWHIASVSKIVSPALRVAHVRAPDAALAARLAGDIHAATVMAPPLNAALVTHWLREGSFADLIAQVRAEGIARQRLVAPLLAGLDHAAHPEGYHLWLRLPGGAPRPAELTARLRPLGLSIVAGERFAVDPAGMQPALRISIGGAIGHERLRRAIEGLRALL